MATAIRTLAAVIAGMLVAFILVVALEMFSAVVHPTPPDFGNTEAEMSEHVARIPHWLLAVAVPAWGFTAFVSTWIAQQIGGRGAAIIVGLLLLAGVVLNISMLPYPIWFKTMGVLVVPTASLLGCRLAIRRKAIGNDDLK